MISGSDADASHRLLRMNMFGFERRSLTLWKKFFSCKKAWQQLHTSKDSHSLTYDKEKERRTSRGSQGKIHNALTVTISVDSALATNTKTSASRQCLSIQRSRFGDTSMPGLNGLKEHGVLLIL